MILKQRVLELQVLLELLMKCIQLELRQLMILVCKQDMCNHHSI